MNYKIPDEVQTLLNIVESNGFTAWCVGGAVRDFLLGLAPSDFDIATNAKPDDIIQLFPHVIKTGIKHGTVTVLINHLPIEVTTYRSEKEYSDFRRPDKVEFLDEIDLDLARRDFTFNAMAYHPDRGLLDPYQGQNDLKGKKIRAVGNPFRRFLEDPLRILRAYRFASVLDFELEQKTESAALEQAELLKNLSFERIYVELSRLLLGKKPSVIEWFINSGALAFLGIKQLKNALLLNNLPLNLELRFASLCFLCEADCELLLKKLKAPNSVVSLTNVFLNLLNTTLAKNKPELKMVLRNNEKTFNTNYYITLLSAREVLFSENNQNLITFCNEIEYNKEPYLIKHLAISGNDLKSFFENGQKIGEMLETLLGLVIYHPELNKKPLLLEQIKKKFV